jgi:hypothetical protein
MNRPRRNWTARDTMLDDQRCVDMMRTFQADHPELWAEDIAE